MPFGLLQMAYGSFVGTKISAFLQGLVQRLGFGGRFDTEYDRQHLPATAIDFKGIG